MYQLAKSYTPNMTSFRVALFEEAYTEIYSGFLDILKLLKLTKKWSELSHNLLNSIISIIISLFSNEMLSNIFITEAEL